ncbi:MAG TPA: ATP-binding protein [Acidimicrobiales bacterium]|nr:ATP-binding protein [Acidimicrobiales bacterium]
MCRTAKWTLNCQPESVPEGRRRLRCTLESWGVAGTDAATAVLPDVLLAASELLANAERFCRRRLVLSVSAHRSRVELAVADDSPAWAVLRHPAPGAESGRGLEIVERLSTRWGQVEWDGDVKRVWWVIAVPDGSALAANCTM